jgi:FixJ family two-component response regulator
MIFRSRFAAHSALGVRRERKTILSSNPVISVVDDDVSVRVATDNLLSALGYIVHTFASAEEFLRSAHFNDTSCVIADVQMPTMSGVELQALLLARGQRLPFIFITAFPDESVRARVQKFGAICLLTKPFDRQSLIKCLDTALQRHDGGTGE